MLFPWRDEYSVENEKIDNQHKKLIGYINELHEAISVGEGREILEEIFDDLVEYTYTHFATEETLLAINHYADIENHKAEHEYLRQEVKKMQIKSKNSSSIAISLYTMEFLKDWLSKHILGTDMKYVQYLKDSGTM